MSELCDDATLAAFVSEMQAAASPPLEKLEALIASYPGDARLHFMKGSALIGEKRLIEGHRALVRAVELAPDFAIARFQLGLFQLTSGEADAALETWGRLDRLPDGHYLRSFVNGLRCLIRDDFAGAIEHLRNGVERNDENPPLNRDMEMLVKACVAQLSSSPSADGEEPLSQTALLLSQLSGDKNRPQ